MSLPLPAGQPVQALCKQVVDRVPQAPGQTLATAWGWPSLLSRSMRGFHPGAALAGGTDNPLHALQTTPAATTALVPAWSQAWPP